MRIPWIGAITMYSQKNGMVTVILGIIIVLLIIFEFILPLVKKRKIQDTEAIDVTMEE
jgi:sorbitol-specific phosphotransferase system component IIC